MDRKLNSEEIKEKSEKKRKIFAFYAKINHNSRGSPKTLCVFGVGYSFLIYYRHYISKTII